MHPDEEGWTTLGAVAYITRCRFGVGLIQASRALTRAADPCEAILVGAGHRLARWGVRVAEVTEPLVEPLHPLARRVAGLGVLPAPKTGRERLDRALASAPWLDESPLLSDDDPRRWT